MTRKAIALSGKSNMGKSATIKNVYALLTKKYGVSNPQVLHETGKDISAIIIIKGVKIGIESEGDPGGRLKISLELFLAESCHVIICSMRTKGSTVRAVENLQPRYTLVRIDQIEKATEAEQEANNKKIAQQIVENAEELILS